VLWRAEELVSIDAVIDRQARDEAIYNALSIGFADYKYAAYRRRRPQIVAIGTSRAMQIRQRFFLVPFYNLGGLTQGPGQANVLADRLLLESPPKILIFALDYWTFCAATRDIAQRTVAETSHDGIGEPQRQFLIYRLLLEGRFSLSDVARLLFLPDKPDDGDRIGLGARLDSSGFAADGSIYGESSDDTPLERRWEGMLARLTAGTDQFVRDCYVSDAALEQLRVFVDRMKKADIQIVLFLAPLPGVVLARMQTDGRYTYIDDLRYALKTEYANSFFDFLDMRAIAPDSEFFDGIHGGEIAYMRIIHEMARLDSSPLHRLVDNQYLETEIALWSGHTQAVTDPIYQRFLGKKTN